MTRNIFAFALSVTSFFYSNLALSQASFSYVVLQRSGSNIHRSNGHLSDLDSKIETESYANMGAIVSIENNHTQWAISLSSATNSDLATGNYLHAGYYPTELFPGLRVKYNNDDYCVSSSGQFVVLDVDNISNESLDKLAVDFVQYCPELGRTVYGSFRYNSTIPDDLDQYIEKVNQQPTLKPEIDLSTGKINLPNVKIGDQSKQIKLSFVSNYPLTLKVDSIFNDTPVTTARAQTFFNEKNATLLISQLHIVDLQNQQHIIKNVNFRSLGDSLQPGSLLVLQASANTQLQQIIGTS